MRHVLDRARTRGAGKLKRFVRQERQEGAVSPQTVRLRREPKNLSGARRMSRFLEMERSQ